MGQSILLTMSFVSFFSFSISWLDACSLSLVLPSEIGNTGIEIWCKYFPAMTAQRHSVQACWRIFLTFDHEGSDELNVWNIMFLRASSVCYLWIGSSLLTSQQIFVSLKNSLVMSATAFETFILPDEINDLAKKNNFMIVYLIKIMRAGSCSYSGRSSNDGELKPTPDLSLARWYSLIIIPHAIIFLNSCTALGGEPFPSDRGPICFDKQVCVQDTLLSGIVFT